jgi:hypothetical protein
MAEQKARPVEVSSRIPAGQTRHDWSQGKGEEKKRMTETREGLQREREREKTC